MKRQQKTTYFSHQTILLSLAVLLLSVFYHFSLSTPTYIGISARKVEGNWRIMTVQKGGAAEPTGLLKGDVMLSIDKRAPEKNAILQKWFIVEQAKTITVKRKGKIISREFIVNHVNQQRFHQSILMVLAVLGFLFWYSRKQIISRRSRYFYYFLGNVVFTLLSIIPSSIGNAIGRFFLVLTLSLFPLFANLFAHQFFKGKEGVMRKGIWRICLLFPLVNVALLGLNLLVNLPLFLVHYLVSGIFYLLITLLFLIFLSNVLEKENESSNSNLLHLSVISFFPFFFCYLLPFGWRVPFPIVIQFLLLSILASFHKLTLSRSFLFRYGISESVLYLILTAVYTWVIVLFILLSAYVPLLVLGVYGVLLNFTLFGIFAEMVAVVRKNKVSNDDLSSFLIAEEERENISTHIHDTVIQELIFFIRTLKEKNSDDSGAIEVLEETVYLLRELCADIYPLMIQELGLKTAMLDMVKQFERKYPVLISTEITVAQFQLSEK
jgi:signal transduction histidine kinase